MVRFIALPTILILFFISCSEKEVIQTDEILAKKYFSLGEEYFYVNDYGRASEMFEKAAGSFPLDKYFFSAGVSRQAMLAYERAIRMYQSTIKLNGKFSEAYYNMALCYDKLGNIEAAHETYLKYQQIINSGK